MHNNMLCHTDVVNVTLTVWPRLLFKDGSFFFLRSPYVQLLFEGGYYSSKYGNTDRYVGEAVS